MVKKFTTPHSQNLSSFCLFLQEFHHPCPWEKKSNAKILDSPQLQTAYSCKEANAYLYV